MAFNVSFTKHLEQLELATKDLQENTNIFFLIVMGCLIFLMQAGFAYIEAGSVRSKNTTNILLKNLLDICLGGIVFWAFGYGFAFGKSENPFCGESYFFLADADPNIYPHWFVHLFFAATSATIVSGAMAERTQFMAYTIFSCFTTGLIYPFVAHWVWSDPGWLNKYDKVPFQDFAGSGVVHMVGGTEALVGAFVLGPRIGRFDRNGKPVRIHGHSIPLVALGGFILIFGFFAFNGVSNNSISEKDEGNIVALAVVNTALSGSMGALVAMAVKRRCYKKKHWSLLTAVNGALTGMAAICAGSNVVEPWGAVVIGSLSGLTYTLGCSLILRLKIDDPIQAAPVHLGGGLLGILSTPFFSFETGIFTRWNMDSGKTLGWNVLGAIVILLWSGVLSLGLFKVLNYMGKLRVSEEVEVRGLDLVEHGEAAYPIASYGHGWEDEESVFRRGTLRKSEVTENQTSGVLQQTTESTAGNDVEVVK